MVHVPVGDEDPLDAVSSRGVARADRDIVENAEAHAAALRRMMTRRPHGAERIGGATAQHRVDG